MNMALLIIDIQEAYTSRRRGQPHFEKTMAYINAAADVFRKANQPVVTVRDIGRGDINDYRNAEELNGAETDIDIVKQHENAFWQTDLESELKELDVDFVVVCGAAAEYCVLSSYNGAVERGFGAAMLQNGIFASSDTGLKDIAFNRPAISYEVISYMLSK